MKWETHENSSRLEAHRLDSSPAGPHQQDGSESSACRQARLLHSICDGLAEDIQVPGMAGQVRLHGRLEDLSEVVHALRDTGVSRSQEDWIAVTKALLHCKKSLFRVDAAFQVLDRWIEERLRIAEATRDYTVTVGELRPRRSGDCRSNFGAVEVEG